MYHHKINFSYTGFLSSYFPKVKLFPDVITRELNCYTTKSSKAEVKILTEQYIDLVINSIETKRI